MGREIRLIRALADEGYQYPLNDGVPPIPRDRMVTFASLAGRRRRRLQAEIEAGGHPRAAFRAREDPDPATWRPRWDLLMPASAEAAAKAAVREPARGARARVAPARPGPPPPDACGRSSSG